MNGFGVVDSTGYSVYDNDQHASVDSSDTSHAQRLRNGKALLQTLYDDLSRR
jgi:hypothetical protein